MKYKLARTPKPRRYTRTRTQTDFETTFTLGRSEKRWKKHGPVERRHFWFDSLAPSRLRYYVFQWPLSNRSDEIIPGPATSTPDVPRRYYALLRNPNALFRYRDNFFYGDFCNFTFYARSRIVRSSKLMTVRKTNINGDFIDPRVLVSSFGNVIMGSRWSSYCYFWVHIVN